MRTTRSLYYNVDWVRQRYYTNDTQRDAEMKSEAVEEETTRHIEEGHERKLERNKPTGANAELHAINGNPEAPQYIYMTEEPSSQNVVIEGMTRHTGNPKLKYWGILESTASRAEVQDLAYNTIPHVGRMLGNLIRRGGSLDEIPSEDEESEKSTA